MDSQAARDGSAEFTLYEVAPFLSEIKREADEDYHVILESEPGSGLTMVVEVVDPERAADSVALADISDTRQRFEELMDAGLVGERVRVRGAGFYDRYHGQKGMAENCLELHPVLEFELAD